MGSWQKDRFHKAEAEEVEKAASEKIEMKREQKKEALHSATYFLSTSHWTLSPPFCPGKFSDCSAITLTITQACTTVLK